MKEKKEWNPTVTNIMKDGTTYTSDEWSEYWKTHTLPLNVDTEPFYKALISIAEEKIKQKSHSLRVGGSTNNLQE